MRFPHVNSEKKRIFAIAFEAMICKWSKVTVAGNYD